MKKYLVTVYSSAAFTITANSKEEAEEAAEYIDLEYEPDSCGGFEEWRNNKRIYIGDDPEMENENEEDFVIPPLDELPNPKCAVFRQESSPQIVDVIKIPYGREDYDDTSQRELDSSNIRVSDDRNRRTLLSPPAPPAAKCWCKHDKKWHTPTDVVREEEILFHCKACAKRKRNGVKANGLHRTFEDHPALFLDEDHELQKDLPGWMWHRSGNDPGAVHRVAYTMGLSWSYFVNYYAHIVFPNEPTRV